MSRRAFLIFMTVNAVLVVLAVLVFTAGCQAPPARGGDGTVDNTTVTFTFETWNTQLRPVEGYEVQLAVTVPGFASINVVDKTTFSYAVSSAKYPAAAQQINVTATVQAPPSTLLTCSWTAVTPTGVRTSDRSRGGEGSSSVFAGATSATTTCQYQA